MNPRSNASPPAVARRMLARLLPAPDRSEILNALAELFARRAERGGRSAAVRWYWRQVVVFPIRLRLGRTGPPGDGGARRRRFGGRGPGAWRVVTGVSRDIRYAARTFARTPGFTAVTVATLALGIGANTAIFSVINGVIIRPLPFPEPERIVSVWASNRITGRQFTTLAERTTSYTALSVASGGTFTLTGEGTPEEFTGSVVGVTHGDVFGVMPALGRPFRASDAQRDAPPVALFSYEFWQRRFGGDPGIVGRTLRIGGEGARTRTVIGVMPPGHQPFRWVSEIFVPVIVAPGDHEYTDMARYHAVGRLGAGIDPTAAQAELRAALVQLAQGEEGGYVVAEDAALATVEGFHRTQVDAVRGTLWVLLAAVTAVLAIACANVANLLLARSRTRERELAIRTAVGAGRRRITRQLLTESIVLALAGGGLGAVAAVVGVPVIVSVLPDTIPRTDAIAVDRWVFAFTLVVTLVCGLAFGMAPALRSPRSVDAVLRGATTRATGARGAVRFNRALIAVELALTVLLVASAGLLLKSFWNLQRVDPGFPVAGLYSMRIRPPSNQYPDEEARRRYFDDIQTRVRAVPGVEAVGAINMLPMTRDHLGVAISPTGDIVPDGERQLVVGYRMITPGYMTATGIPMLEGRDLSPTDRASGPPVGLINRRLATTLWPGEGAVGKRVVFGNGELWFTVVGVVDDIHQHALDMSPRTEVYVPYAQDSWSDAMYLMVRVGAGANPMGAVQRAIWSADENVPIADLTPMEVIVAQSMATARFYTILFASFAGLALLLGAIGVYGVTWYTMSERAREIGIRMALGARRTDIFRTAVRFSLGPVVTGLIVGLTTAFAVTRFLTTFLFQVTAVDPSVFAGAALFLLAVALAAALLPARRAAGADPLISLDRA